MTDGSPALGQIVHCYWHNRIAVPQPTLTALAVLALMAVAAVATRTRRPTTFLNRDQSDQLRGFAILMIVAGHVWAHVSSTQPAFNFTGDAMGVFLMLSGYGLTLSMRKDRLPFHQFLRRRVRRVMVPYWVITVGVLVLDYLLLRQTHSARDLLLTFAGINVSASLVHIDFVRWFVTFILAWYLAFYAAEWLEVRFGWNAALLLTGAAVAMLLLEAYATRWEWYQFFAFPAGCALGKYRGRVNEIFERRPRLLMSLAAGLVLFALLRETDLWRKGMGSLPWVGRVLAREVMGVGLAAAFVTLGVGAFRAGYASRFLLLAGALSYELFLLHGPFMVKYNPFFALLPPRFLPLSFLLLLAFLLLLSWAVHIAVGRPRGGRGAGR